ncbi:MAG: aldehyde dehydrogenase family protein [Thermoanaerobaculales bacterium]|jgi:succinate-semialdehyde dehydrogenase/glutarate-semialdehyde dehydrogenase|nr:aldehyde dehydrogenase family protein [Thermoanaerobaculales bacterium]
MKLPSHSIIGNREIEGPRTITSFDPATGREVGAVTALDADGVGLAVEAARRAFTGWAATPVAGRAAILQRWLEIMIAEADEVAALATAENGKPISEALLVDIVPACATLEYWAGHAERHLAFQRVAPEQLLFAHWRLAGYRLDPLGVLAAITPWNYPVAIPMWEIVPALVAGNTVVFKPASATVLTGLALVDQARRAGLPEGVLNGVALPGSVTDALVDHPGVAKVFFTGSVGVGRHVAGRCAARLAPVQLELGGNDAAVVAADAPLERTARSLVWGAFMNSGQSCASVERVFAVDEIHDRLVRRIVQLTAELKVGDPTRRDTDLGPLTTSEQRDTVVAHVADAVAKGARVLCGGAVPDGPGWFYPPTVLVDVTDEMLLMHEETFGPTLPVIRVRDLDEAIARANDSRFGLTASGFTASHETAARLQRELAAGVVGINEHGIVAAGEVTGSWGGLGESGIGRAHGPFGLHEMVNVKYVFTDPGDDPAAPWHYPYDEDFAQFIGAAVPYLFTAGMAKHAHLRALASTRRFVERVRKTTLLRHLDKLV